MRFEENKVNKMYVNGRDFFFFLRSNDIKLGALMTVTCHCISFLYLCLLV